MRPRCLTELRTMAMAIVAAEVMLMEAEAIAAMVMVMAVAMETVAAAITAMVVAMVVVAAAIGRVKATHLPST